MPSSKGGWNALPTRLIPAELSLRGDVGDSVLYHSLLGLESPQQILGALSEMLVLRPSEAKTLVSTCQVSRTYPFSMSALAMMCGLRVTAAAVLNRRAETSLSAN
jgi:hypothetical protein